MKIGAKARVLNTPKGRESGVCGKTVTIGDQDGNKFIIVSNEGITVPGTFGLEDLYILAEE